MKIKVKKIAKKMQGKVIKFAGTGFLLTGIIVSSVNSANATWLDDWYSDVMSTSSGVNYFEGQKRGYATFGSFSARLPVRTDYLFSIEKPHLKVGCGGIDLFMGGFSFLNTDYLVQKIQRMMQAAPFIAFDVALQTLWPEGSEILKKAEAIIDALNQIQLSECGIYIPKTIVDIAKDPGAFFKTQAEKNAGIAQNKGFSNFWKNFWDRYVHITGSDVQMEGVSQFDVTKGLSPLLQGWLAQSQGTGFVSYLASQGKVDSTIADIFKAYVGDLVFTANDDKTIFNIQFQPSKCKEAHVKDALQKGTIYRASGSGCVAEDSTQITQQVENAILNAYNTIKSKGTLPSNVQKLIEISPTPLYLFFKVSILMQDNSILTQVAPSVSKGLIYNALLDLTKKMRTVIKEVEDASKVPNNTNSEGKEIAIQINNEGREELQKYMRNFEEDLYKGYGLVLADVQKGIELTTAYLKFQEIVEKNLKISRSFVLGRPK